VRTGPGGGTQRGSLGQKLELDARYAEAPSLRGDLRIIWRCMGVLLRSEGVSAPGHATAPAFEGGRPGLTP
jgi:hypothetical protein